VVNPSVQEEKLSREVNPLRSLKKTSPKKPLFPRQQRGEGALRRREIRIISLLGKFRSRKKREFVIWGGEGGGFLNLRSLKGTP